LSRDTDRIAYDSGLTFFTADAPVFDFMITFGVPLWKGQ
jgi:hypothetical protein